MKFLVDENIGLKVVGFLNQQGHTTEHISDIQIGIEDYQILSLSVLKNSIVITFDRDFGELVFKAGKQYHGVIYLRLENQTSENVIKALNFVFSTQQTIRGNFIIVSEKNDLFRIRIRRISK
jgi:predicted nuclease of predicted toxin-antitoxin system